MVASRRPQRLDRERVTGAVPAGPPPLVAQRGERLVLVGGVLEDDAERGVDGLLVEVVDLEGDEGAGPVDGLGDGRRLLQLHLAQPRDRLHELGGEPVVEVGHLGEHDLLLTLDVGVVEVQEEAATLERLGELTGGVRGQHHEGSPYGGDGAHLGDGDLEVAEHLEQQPLDLDVGLVDLVDEQHRRLLAPDGGQQRAGEQELVGEDVVVGLLPGLVAGGGLDAEELFLVVPLIKRAGLVETLVALQADQVGAARAGDRLGQLGLADPGRALDQQRLLQRAGEVGRRRGGRVGEVGGLVELLGRVRGGLEPGHRRSLVGGPVLVPAGCRRPCVRDPVGWTCAGHSLQVRRRFWALGRAHGAFVVCGE